MKRDASKEGPGPIRQGRREMGETVKDRSEKDYQPEPLDTSGVTLTDDIRELTELLAKNTHEVWAKQRVSEGWSYGPQRDDAKKEHPGLIPYEDLSTSEQEYDRNTALETLRVIIALGYEINKVDEDQ
jgi:hypothetical protein